MSKSTESYPPWTDEFIWELGPDPDDVREASEFLNGDDYDTDEHTPDHVLEEQAGEALARQRLEQGLRCF